MPRLDGTGPAGKGSKTGGQRGNCPSVTPKSMPRNGNGKGLGSGRGRAQGRGNGRMEFYGNVA